MENTIEKELTTTEKTFLRTINLLKVPIGLFLIFKFADYYVNFIYYISTLIK